MAVIESKGDGFALYNGVKLPKLPEYDKDKYPYAYIESNEVPEILPLIYTMRAMSTPYTYGGDGKLYFNKPQARMTIVYDTSKPDGWVVSQVTDDKGGSYDAINTNVNAVSVWSNYDIINTTDNTVYLAASEPISLDGMNVIEWDGDTTGLETLMSNAYFVSHNTDVDTDKDVVYVSTGGVNPLFGITALQNFDIGYWGINRVMNYSTVASEDYPIVGIEFQSSSKGYTSLFAYYPIAEEQPEIDRGTLFILYRMFSPVVFHALTGKNHWSD